MNGYPSSHGGDADARAAAVPIDAVIFDWGGTLTPWHPIDAREAWRSYAAGFYPEPSHAAESTQLAAALVAAEEAAWCGSREEQCSATLARIFDAAAVGVEAARRRRALAAFVDFWAPHSLTDPEVPALFGELRARGIRIGVLSNTMWTREMHEDIFRRDRVLELIDGAVYSSEIACTKPDPAAFRAALAAVGVDDPARAVFVGDRLFDDVFGANRVGMRAIHVPHSAIPAAQLGHTDGAPDAVVDRLGEVAEVVRCWSAGREWQARRDSRLRT